MEHERVMILLKGKKWVGFRYNSDGSIDRYKAGLVVKGYNQTYEIDYEESFTHVSKINRIQVLLSLQQYNVKNAFLHMKT